MIFEFRMPDIGEGIAEIEIVEWLVAVGDHVDEDQLVVSIQTDKSLVDMPTPIAGTLSELAAGPGDIVPVGGVLFALDRDAAPAPSAQAADPPAPKEQPTTPDGPTPTVSAPHSATSRDASPAPSTSGRVKAAPAVRRLADEHGVDLAAVAATGPGGRVTKDDVMAVAAGATTPGDPEPRPTPTAWTPGSVGSDGSDVTVPLRGLRRQIAKNMLESWRNIPHITDWRQADARGLIAARAALRDSYPDQAPQLTFLPLLVKIVATGLREHPLMNARLSQDNHEYVLHGHIHIGVATSTPDGLLVPVVRDADHKSIIELATEIAELVDLTRRRKATHTQLTGGTYTVNNVGALGATMATPIIRPPEVGILGFGRIVDTVVAVEGVPAVRPVMTLSSVGDHRLHDGETLSAFTAHIVALIEQPARLLGTLR